MDLCSNMSAFSVFFGTFWCIPLYLITRNAALIWNMRSERRRNLDNPGFAVQCGCPPNHP